MLLSDFKKQDYLITAQIVMAGVINAETLPGNDSLETIPESDEEMSFSSQDLDPDSIERQEYYYTIWGPANKNGQREIITINNALQENLDIDELRDAINFMPLK